MNLYKSLNGTRQRFATNWRKRNWVTDIFLYGIQIAAILCSVVMVVEMIEMIFHFLDPYPLSRYENLTIGGLIFRMVSKGWLVGLVACIIGFICNRRVIRWKLDGLLWLFILLFGISIATKAVENEMFLYFSGFSVGALLLYFLSLLLPKRVGETNTTTFQQCRRPSNWLITLSFIIMLLWVILLCEAINSF